MDVEVKMVSDWLVGEDALGAEGDSREGGKNITCNIVEHVYDVFASSQISRRL